MIIARHDCYFTQLLNGLHLVLNHRQFALFLHIEFVLREAVVHLFKYFLRRIIIRGVVIVFLLLLHHLIIFGIAHDGLPFIHALVRTILLFLKFTRKDTLAACFFKVYHGFDLR